MEFLYTELPERIEKTQIVHNFQLRPYSKGFLGDHDTIIRKISDGISPMPIGIRLKEVEFPEGFVAVFQIQESLTKPHQTGNIYQIRIDGQKKPAPHYLIEAMMKQVRWPELNGSIRFLTYGKAESFHIFNLKFVLANKTPSQNAKNIELSLKWAIRAQVKSHQPETIPFVSSGLSQSIDFKIEIENDLFQQHSDTDIEFALIFGGENTKPKITYYKLKLPQAFGTEIIYEYHFSIISENLGIEEFVQKHIDQRVISKL